MHAVLRERPTNSYSVHELQAQGGINVREYVSAQGQVFAVTWRGRALPDLEQLLGNYFPAFHDAAVARKNAGVRGPLTLRQDDLVIQSAGHLRTFFGKAYVPSLLPPQVTVEEIQ